MDSNMDLTRQNRQGKAHLKQGWGVGGTVQEIKREDLTRTLAGNIPPTSFVPEGNTKVQVGH